MKKKVFEKEIKYLKDPHKDEVPKLVDNFNIFLDKNGVLRVNGKIAKCSPNGPGELGSIPGRVIPKTLKIVLDTALFNTQQYKVRIKGEVKQSREKSSALPYTSV